MKHEINVTSFFILLGLAVSLTGCQTAVREGSETFGKKMMTKVAEGAATGTGKTIAAVLTLSQMEKIMNQNPQNFQNEVWVLDGQNNEYTVWKSNFGRLAAVNVNTGQVSFR